MRAPCWRAGLAGLGLASLLASAAAQDGQVIGRSIGLAGTMGGKALLMIDGKPRTLAVGASHDGVRLVSLEPQGDAVVDVQGRRVVLRLGAAPASVGDGPRAGAGTQIKLVAGPGGHFLTGGMINGRTVQFVVDTGATTIAIGQADAQRIGLDLRNAQAGLAQTANGTVPVHRVTLNSVRIGDVEVYNVEASVIPSQLSHVLLGNSFLTRFQMKRENDVMTLDKRP